MKRLLVLLPPILCWSVGVHAVPIAKHGDLLDRRMAAERLQNYSDYSGWEAHFSVHGDEGRTLRMTGNLLCGEEFPVLIPKAAWALVPEAGFTRFECSLPGDATTTTIAVAPPG